MNTFVFGRTKSTYLFLAEQNEHICFWQYKMKKMFLAEQNEHILFWQNKMNTFVFGSTK
jgi:hypothetical protein